LILKSHEPYPALAVDRHWNLLAGNAMLPHLMAGADPELLQGKVNVLRLEPAPQGPRRPGSSTWASGATICSNVFASRSTPLATACWRRCWKSCVPIPCPRAPADTHLDGELLGVAMPFKFQTQFGVLNFISTTYGVRDADRRDPAGAGPGNLLPGGRNDRATCLEN
jgi:hypothetical protein